MPGYPASKVLKAGDVIEAVDGKPVDRADVAELDDHGASGRARCSRSTVLRDGKTLTDPGREQGRRAARAVIGVEVQQQYKFPFTVSISVGNIGGPSAGMMFALGIIDKLTPINLTGGKFIAGTGEITASGQVQPIGGIQQKMVGARSAGATIFLTPAGNCSDTAGRGARRAAAGEGVHAVAGGVRP